MEKLLLKTPEVFERYKCFFDRNDLFEETIYSKEYYFYFVFAIKNTDFILSIDIEENNIEFSSKDYKYIFVLDKIFDQLPKDVQKFITYNIDMFS